MPSTSSTPASASHGSDKRRWNAFVCQDCRAIFRIPAHYEGRGVVCPACDRMLRLPQAGESLPPLVSSAREDSLPAEEADESAISTEPAGSWDQEEASAQAIASSEPEPSPDAIETKGEWRRRKKHRSRGKNAENDWQQDDRKMLRFSRTIPLAWWGAGAGLFLVVLSAALYLLLRPKQDHIPAADVATMPALTPLPLDQNKDAAAAQQLSQIREAHEAIETFFRAKKVEELLPLLRPAQDLEEKVRRYYATRPLPDPRYEGLEKASSTLLAEGACLQTEIRLKNQSTRFMTLFQSGDRYLVDWESWVMWCDMDYHAFTQKKPLQPIEVRVIVETESYYNYDFPSTAEQEWQSYRLVFVGEDDAEDRILHGYVPRGSAVHQAVALASDVLARPMTLRIRYRDEDSHHTQVLIDSVAADSWVKGMPAE